MSHDRPFAQVDVFSAHPYKGNPVAVILDGEGLTDEEMQAVARWANLSETTFVLPPTTDAADYRLRIFTPGGELPFAGHPTLGSAHAWLENGGTPRDPETIVQEVAATGAYRVSQGTKLGRAGDITVTPDETGTVWVGGATTTLFRGTATA